MIRSMNSTRAGVGAALAAMMAAAACGTENSPAVSARLEVPEMRDARITVTPAFDVSSLYDGSIADRIVIEEITINLADARLLAADPRIPRGGLDLMRSERIVAAYGSED